MLDVTDIIGFLGISDHHVIRRFDINKTSNHDESQAKSETLFWFFGVIDIIVIKIAKRFAEKPKNVPKMVNFCKKVTHVCNPDNVLQELRAWHFEHEVHFLGSAKLIF